MILMALDRMGKGECFQVVYEINPYIRWTRHRLYSRSVARFMKEMFRNSLEICKLIPFQNTFNLASQIFIDLGESFRTNWEKAFTMRLLDVRNAIQAS